LQNSISNQSAINRQSEFNNLQSHRQGTRNVNNVSDAAVAQAGAPPGM
jgi:hypothetical protein